MANPQAAESASALRMLPSTDDLLTTASDHPTMLMVGRRTLTILARSAIESVRKELAASISDQPGRREIYSKESLLAAASERLKALCEERRQIRPRKVINATGVVIHTNLGRAPLSVDAIKAIDEAAGYCTLEYDLSAGRRGKRGAYVESLLTELTGSEAALVVNNCAAAAFLVLKVFADGGEVIVSRGELVEIGGDFRIPDVLVQSGAALREVGTTNRTKLSDYEKAFGEDTRLVLRVHPSNYKIVGFTEKPELAHLVELAHKKGVLLYEDAGSGALLDLTKFGLTDEPLISRAIEDGADIVTFSGDKLLGGVQSGLVVGRRDLIEQVRKHPLYRALRVDKLSYAALAATLESYIRGEAEQNIPVLRMLSLTNEELEGRSREFVKRLEDALKSSREFAIEIIAGESVVGGGSAPALRPATTLIAIRHSSMSASEIESKLRSAEVPVIARIENNIVLLDLRTVQETEEDSLIQMLASAIG